MKKFLLRKYEGVYVYHIIIAFICLLVLGLLIFFNLENIIKSDYSNDSKEIVLDRNELDLISFNINNIASSSWDDLYKSNSLRDIYRNNYRKYISNITSNLELGNILYEYNGSIGDKYYNIKLNNNKWFLFNKINNDSSVSFYIINNNMDFLEANVEVTNNINVYNDLDKIKLYNIDNFYYYYEPTTGSLYGTKYILKDKDINYYFTININGIKINEELLENFLKNLNNNIKISIVDDINYKGIKLPNNLEYVYINDSFMYDFKTNVNVIDWYNDLNKCSIVIDLVSNNSKKKYKIEETIVDNIDSHVINKGSRGSQLYNYFSNNIYLKYDLKKYKKFNTTSGAINGIIIYIDNRMYDISFDEVEFSSQEELNNILSDMKSFIITNS